MNMHQFIFHFQVYSGPITRLNTETGSSRRSPISEEDVLLTSVFILFYRHFVVAVVNEPQNLFYIKQN